MAERTVKALKANGFHAEYFPTKEDAAERILEETRNETFIGAGGSNTIRELGILDVLEQQGKTIFDHWKEDDPKDALRVRRSQLTCDLFLCGANAITEAGEIVNTDSVGNRVGAMSFGPRKVIIVAGVNKIVEDIPEAFRRIQRIAAPCNAHRMGLKTSCAKTGRCDKCDSSQRICNISVILHRKPPHTDIRIVLIGESLGF